MTEGLYKLPQGWRWVRLGEVCETTERRNPTKDPLTCFLYVDITSVDNREGQIVAPKAMLGKDAPSRARKVIRENDVIFATTRPYLKNIAIVPLELDGQICSTGFCILRANSELLDHRFLYHICRSDLVVSQLLNKSMRGASYPAVTDGNVHEAFIPLPPLEEQRRIVEKVDALMARVREARRLRVEALADAERLMQAALAEAFPRPGADLPAGWRWVRLGEVAWRDADLVNPTSPNESELVNYLGMEQVAPGQWEEPEPNLITPRTISSTCVAFRPGHVLYGKLRPYLNKVVVCSRSGIASTEFVPIATHGESLRPDYLGAFLRSPNFVRYATANITGSRQPRVRLDALWDALIPLPPLEEQRRIVAYLDAVQERVKALKAAQAATEAELKRLEQAILDKAFRGEL